MDYESAWHRTQPSSSSRDGRFNHVLAALLVLFAAGVAAVIAHLLIDLAGDFVLVHDAYDNAAHASRFIAFDAAIFGGFAVAWHIISTAFAQARGANRMLRAAAERVVAGSAPWFIGRVVLVTIGVLAVMGVLDARLDAIRIDDPGDIFGGSSLLGISVSVPVGATVGAAVFGILRWIAISHHSIVAAVASLFSFVAHMQQNIAPARRCRRLFSWYGSVDALARRAGKRAPPPLDA